MPKKLMKVEPQKTTNITVKIKNLLCSKPGKIGANRCANMAAVNANMAGNQAMLSIQEFQSAKKPQFFPKASPTQI